MAAHCVRAMKLVTVPALCTAAVGITVHAEGTVKEGDAPQGRVYRACDLPLYNSASRTSTEPVGEFYPRNVVEEKIGDARKAVFETASSFKGTYESVQDTVNIGVEHTRSSLDYVQNNPGELPRVAFIALAGMGGVVLGYRGSIVRKFLYSSVGMASMAALCYPKTTLEWTKVVTDEVNVYWRDIGGKALVDQYWPFGEKGAEPKAPEPPKVEKAVEPVVLTSRDPVVKRDEGQSNPGDKDMYSTRSS